MRFTALALSCLLTACAPSTIAVDGYLAQVGYVSVFSDDAQFADWAIVDDGPPAYRAMTEKNGAAASQGRCGATLWRIAGTVQHGRRGFKFLTITQLSRINREQANRIARQSAHPTLMTVTFC